MTKFVFCQSTFPVRAVINKDTCVVLSPVQVKTINLAYNDLHYYHSMTDTLKAAVVIQDSLIHAKNLLLLNYDSRLGNCQKINENNKKIVADYQDVIKASSRRLWLLKLERNVLAVAVITGAIDIFVIHK